MNLHIIDIIYIKLRIKFKNKFSQPISEFCMRNIRDISDMNNL